MTTPEMLAALDGMVCVVDTREQQTPRLQRRLKDIGVPYVRETLKAGDYSAKFPLPSGEWVRVNVAVERKMSLDELASCYCTGRGRFKREFERAKEAGTKLYLLVENATWENLYAGRYRSQMDSNAFVASLLAWLARYNCQVLFCKPETTGKLIHDTLYREGKEALERMVDE